MISRFFAAARSCRGFARLASGTCRPSRIVLIRHGESLGNVDESAYVTTPDWKIPLTEKGKEQARIAGGKLKSLVGNQPVMVFVSPYLRTRQTFEEIETALDPDQIVKVRQEPRLVEQQFGNYQVFEDVQQAKKDRHRFGRFFFRFPKGESGLDVYNRVTSFIGTMLRDIQNTRLSVRDLDLDFHAIDADGDGQISYEEFMIAEKKAEEVQYEDMTIVMVTHGLTLRLFLMRWFQFDVEVFEQTHNPPNASVIVMESQKTHDNNSRFQLTEDSQRLLGWNPDEHMEHKFWQ